MEHNYCELVKALLLAFRKERCQAFTEHFHLYQENKHKLSTAKQKEHYCYESVQGSGRKLITAALQLVINDDRGVPYDLICKLLTLLFDMPANHTEQSQFTWLQTAIDIVVPFLQTHFSNELFVVINFYHCLRETCVDWSSQLYNSQDKIPNIYQGVISKWVKGSLSACPNIYISYPSDSSLGESLYSQISRLSYPRTSLLCRKLKPLSQTLPDYACKAAYSSGKVIVVYEQPTKPSKDMHLDHAYIQRRPDQNNVIGLNNHLQCENLYPFRNVPTFHYKANPAEAVLDVWRQVFGISDEDFAKDVSDYFHTFTSRALDSTTVLSWFKLKQSPLEAVQQKVDNASESVANCCVCLDAVVKIVFNCGHTACESCAKQLNVCPKCRVHIGQKNPLFL